MIKAKIGCNSCPVGRFDEYDCGFPDCVGGWEKAFHLQGLRLQEAMAELIRLKAENERMRETNDIITATGAVPRH